MSKTFGALIAVIAILASPHDASAQPEVSDAAATRAASVEVRTADGHTLRGRLLDLGSESVTILAKDGRQTIRLDRVSRIETPRDSFTNGIIIGATVLGGLCAAVCGQGLNTGSNLPLAIAVNALYGGLIGWGIDAAHSNRRTIYQTQSATAMKPSLRLSARFNW